MGAYIFLFHIFLKQVENLNCLFYERHGVREAWKRQFVMGVPWVLEAKTPKRPPKTDNIAPPPPSHREEARDKGSLSFSYSYYRIWTEFPYNFSYHNVLGIEMVSRKLSVE